MRRIFLFALLPCLTFAQPPSLDLKPENQFATCETTADGSIHGRTFNGLQEILTASKPADAILLRFRTALIERWGVQKAIVAIHIPDGANVPESVIVSAVQAQWTESSTTAPPLEPGIPAPARKLKQGWFTIELSPNIARQLASGAASSIALSPTQGVPLSVHSRRTGQFMPYLLVRGRGPLPRKP